LPVFHQSIGEGYQRVKNDRAAGKLRQACQDQHILLADVDNLHCVALGSARISRMPIET
jgi:hypothetical protein